MKHRRLFATCALVLVALALGSSARAASVSEASRPNILWIVSEDNTYNFVDFYGDPLARTPHLHELAARGVVFDHIYSTAPVCAPARSSIITGCYASSLGTQHMRSQRALPAGVKFFPEYLRAAGYFCTNNAKTDYNTSDAAKAGAAAWDENGKTAHWRHRRAGQPFFAVFNCELSHESRLFTREPLITDPAKVRVPAYLPDTPETRADLAQYYDCVSRADAFLGKILAQLAADGLADNTIVFYYSDNGGILPRSKRFLFDNGTHVAGAAYFPEKFRALAPPAVQGRDAELINFVDLAPTMLSLAGVPQPAQFQGRAFAGPARQPGPEFTYLFRDRMDERYDFSRAVTDGRYRYVRHYLPHRPAGQHLFTLWREASMQRWDELHRAGKLNATQEAFFEPKAAEELFDCTTDPENVHNLAADAAHRATLERLRAANRAHLLRIRDTGFLPEPMMIALAGKGSVAAIAARKNSYPLERLIDLVDACQLGRSGEAAVHAALRDPLPVVRYWAVIGSFSLGAAPDVRELLADADPSVRVAAAEAILRRGANDAAWQTLREAFDARESREVRLTVLNALAYLPPAPAAFRPLIEAAGKEVADEKNDQYVPRAADYLLDTKWFVDAQAR